MVDGKKESIVEIKNYDNGRELMEAVFRGEITSRLPRDGVDYLNIMFMPEYPQVLEDGGGYDPFGVYMKLTPDGFTPTGTVIDDIEDWEQVQFPDPADLGMEEDAKKVLANFDKEKMMLRMDIPYCHFERLWSIVGFENALVGFYTAPECIHAMLAKLTDYFIEKFKLIKKYYDVDILVCHDDWGGNTNMFFSPELWREFIKPELKRMVDAVHEMGMYYEQHSCGHIQEIVGDLVELGVDALQPLMASCNDIPMIKSTYGDKIVLFGCCDTRGIVDQGADEETVRLKARTSFEQAGKGGRFMPSLVVYGEGNDWKKAVIEDELEKFEATYLRG